MARVHVSIGSNIDRAANIRAGVAALRDRYGDITLSSVYDSRAVGFDGDDFYNLVAAFDTDDGVDDVAACLREIEHRQGRVRAPRTGGFVSRTLDIDLLLYDELVTERNGFCLPRDEILKYAFVLAPLAEIAGETRHPLLKRTFRELWEDFGKGRESVATVDFDWGPANRG
jgi:2-amino-4-hydroxy-6-hydroxymethyldihydropteridine diphosphokinase